MVVKNRQNMFSLYLKSGAARAILIDFLDDARAAGERHGRLLFCLTLSQSSPRNSIHGLLHSFAIRCHNSLFVQTIAHSFAMTPRGARSTDCFISFAIVLRGGANIEARVEANVIARRSRSNLSRQPGSNHRSDRYLILPHPN